MKSPFRSWLKPQYVFRPSQLARRCIRGILRSPSAEVRARLPWGSEILIRPNGGSVGQSIWYLGVHDLLVCEALWRLTDPGDVAVDGGANIGQMTTLLRVRVGPAGRVVAVEPHPEIADTLERNLGAPPGEPALGRVEIHRVALDATAGARTLFEGENFAANRGTALLVERGGRGIRVPATTLDELFPQDSLGVLKLDLEGGEERALAGAERLLREGRVRHLVIEADDRRFAAIRFDLEERGYRSFGLSERLRGPELVAPERWLGARYEAPSYLATRLPPLVMKRFQAPGWRCLAGSATRA